jgi:hypothetical protein
MTRKPAMSNASTAPDPRRQQRERAEAGRGANRARGTHPEGANLDKHRVDPRIDATHVDATHVDAARPNIERADAEHFDAEDFFGLQRTTSDRLPDPLPLLENLSRCVIEVLAGARELDQLARWVTDDVYRHLLKRVVLAARARAVSAAPVRRPQLSIGHTVVCCPRPDVVEAVIVVHGRARSRAVAIRLEGLDSRWRASAVSVL